MSQTKLQDLFKIKNCHQRKLSVILLPRNTCNGISVSCELLFKVSSLNSFLYFLSFPLLMAPFANMISTLPVSCSSSLSWHLVLSMTCYLSYMISLKMYFYMRGHWLYDSFSLNATWSSFNVRYTTSPFILTLIPFSGRSFCVQ